MASEIDRPTPEAAAFLDSLSDEDLALFADSLAVQRELEAEEAAAAGQMAPPEDYAEDEERLVRALEAEAPAPMRAEPARVVDEEPIAGVVPMRRPVRKGIARGWMGLAAAAVIAAIAVPFLSRARGALGEPTEYAVLLAQPDAALPPDIDKRPWGSQNRGSGHTPAELRDAARAGAFVVDLEIAIRSGDAPARALYAEHAARLLEQLGNAGPDAAKQFRALAARADGDEEALLADLAAATETAEDAVDRDQFALGAWAEAARIAVRREDAVFFRTERTRGTLQRAERKLDGESRNALQRVRAAAEAEPPDMRGLRSAIDDLFFEIG